MNSKTFLELSLISLLLAIPSGEALGGASVLRKIDQGTVRGIHWDDSTLAWLGLPYATPPVEELRWKAPGLPEPFADIYDGNDFSSECTQVGGLLLDLDAETFGTPMGSEDCLYLNIWRPDTHGKNLPVFVWIHGGMNSVGEGATSLYHGANLARGTDAVVVTINYRIGLFGWFAHEALGTGDAEDDSGNYGLLDIIAALKWVNTNIASFGGNPENVTIAGESGGGYNVISLLASPLATGLFHRAIAASPSASLTGLGMEQARNKGAEIFERVLLARGLASTHDEAEALISARGPDWVKTILLSLDKEEIVSISSRISDLGLNEVGLITDVMGASRFEDGTVITKGYKSAVIAGDVSRVPLILGNNTEEFKIFQIAFGIITKLDEYDVLRLIKEFTPTSSGYEATDFMSWMKLPTYQFLGAALGKTLFEKTGVDSLAKHYVKYSDVYVYKFSWNDQPKPFDFLIGASHMMELPFIFGNFQTDQRAMFRFAWSDDNRAKVIDMSRTIMGFISNFMRTGDPNRGPTVVPTWRPWSNGALGRKRLIWDDSFKMGK